MKWEDRVNQAATLAQYKFPYVYDALYSTSAIYSTTIQIIDKAFKLNTYLPRRIIDLGCGTGTLLRELEHYGFNCFGVDISREMLSVAHNKLTNTGLIYADIIALPLIEMGDLFSFVTSTYGVQQYIKSFNLLMTFFTTVRQMLFDG